VVQDWAQAHFGLRSPTLIVLNYMSLCEYICAGKYGDNLAGSQAERYSRLQEDRLDADSGFATPDRPKRQNLRTPRVNGQRVLVICNVYLKVVRSVFELRGFRMIV
jgi:hypothetical protein